VEGEREAAKPFGEASPPSYVTHLSATLKSFSSRAPLQVRFKVSGIIQLLQVARSSVTNREVFSVPGNITSRNSFGTNYLIKGASAKLVQQWQDVVSELPPEIAARILPPEPKKKEKGMVEQLALVPDGLSATEHTVWKLLSTDEPSHIDALAGASKLSISELTGALLGLEMRDLVRQLPGKCFVRKI